MPIFGTLLTGAFAALFEFFVRFMQRDYAIKIAMGVMIGAGFLVLSTSVNVAMALLTVSMPDNLARIFLFALPGNVNGAITFVLTTEAACTAFKLWVTGLGR
jgi:hypothetical protein